MVREELADSSADADVLKVEGGNVEMTGLNLNTRSVLVKSLLAQTEGSALLSDLSVDFATLTKELISGKDSLTLTRSTFVAGTSSHTTNAADVSTIAFTVKYEQKLKIGDLTNELTFSNCGGDDGVELELTNTKLSSLRTSLGGGGVHVSVLSGGRATIVDSLFDGCSASGEGGGMQVKVAGTGSVSISGTFKSCSSDDVGGGSWYRKTGHSVFIRTAADKRGLVNETSVVGSGLSLPSGSVFTAAELELWSFSETNGLSGGIAYLFNIYEGGTLIQDNSGRGAIKFECGDLVTAESLIVKAEIPDCESTNENGESDIEKKGELRMTDKEDATGDVNVKLFDPVGAIGE
ncbi:hypothetical protein BLNAU_24966 [Blattamonas nauphoetae]|uniref:Uncharacterized protein n=1 Tax=Blattamonas nauphoetae TaxID=2049346 RepID=A0ABQ9WKY7_9EUKA|nr:hypothetical protein BLNAU_24966 [Blattamonas nauphoetae]